MNEWTNSEPLESAKPKATHESYLKNKCFRSIASYTAPSLFKKFPSEAISSIMWKSKWEKISIRKCEIFAIWYVVFCHLTCVFLPFGYFWCECNMHSSKSCDKVEHAQYFDINGKNISHLQVDIFSNFDISHIRRNGFWFVLLPAWCLEVWPWLMLGLAVMVIEKTWY